MISRARLESTTRPCRYDSSAASMPASSSGVNVGASFSTASTTYRPAGSSRSSGGTSFPFQVRVRVRRGMRRFYSSRCSLCRHSRAVWERLQRRRSQNPRNLQVAVRLRRLLHERCLILQVMQLHPTIIGIALAAAVMSACVKKTPRSPLRRPGPFRPTLLSSRSRCRPSSNRTDQHTAAVSRCGSSSPRNPQISSMKRTQAAS